MHLMSPPFDWMFVEHLFRKGSINILVMILGYNEFHRNIILNIVRNTQFF